MKVPTILDHIDTGHMALPEFQRGYVCSLGAAGEISWGRGARSGFFNPKFLDISPQSLFSAYSYGKLLFNFGWHEGSGAKYAERFAVRLVEDVGLALPESYMIRHVSFRDGEWVTSVEEIIMALEGPVSAEGEEK